MRAALKKVLLLLLVLSFFSSHASASTALPMNRHEFVGRFIEATIESGAAHLVTMDNYFFTIDSPEMYYIFFSEETFIQMACDSKGEKLYNIMAAFIGSDPEEIMSCISEIAYAMGAIGSLSPEISLSQRGFLSDIGLLSAQMQDGASGSLVRNGIYFEWFINMELGGMFFFVEPAY